MTEKNVWLSIPDAFSAMVLARAGFDSVTLDTQHGLFDESAVAATLMALGEAQPKRFVRPMANDPAMVGKLLDMGADGLIVPMVNSVGDALKLSAACFYPPRGARSFGPMLAALRAGAALYTGGAANFEIYAMIETREGLDAAREIAAVDGITGLFAGPNDLGLALGLGPGSDREEPEALQALARIVSAAHETGKRAGIFCSAAAYARRMAEMGFDMVTLTSDAASLRAGAAAALAAFCA